MTLLKHAYAVVIVFALAIPVALFSCGDGSITGAGGSWGEDLTNTRVSLGLYPESLEIDICNEVSVGLLANISAQQINPALPPNILYLEGYEVAFEPIDKGSPVIRGGIYMLSKVLPSTGNSLFFIDPGLKSAFLNDINSGKYPDMTDFPSYWVDYKVYGTDTFNNTPKVWGSRARLSFKVGRYSTCVPYIVPETDIVYAIPHPDTSLDDNRIFHISGGAAPYTLTSSDNSLLKVVSGENEFSDLPLVLPMGLTSFEIDFNPYILDGKVVSLILRDSIGEMATAEIIINIY